MGGRYRLVDEVGSGGMGKVWRAHDELLGRSVAVKEVCLPQLSGLGVAEVRERTMREARAAARLSHPNAVTVHDVIEQDDQLWIVMALIEADSLADVLAHHGPLRPHQVAEIGLALLGALHAAHAAGILHRDVKPANVLLGRNGRVVLTDFGVATLDGDPALTTTGMLLGSPAYMAPERALGMPTGPASDLWSLGATLFAALEGRPPFDRRTSMATLTALATEDPPQPVNAGVLAPVIAGLLQRDPQRRLDAGTARRLLTAALAGADEPPTVISPAPETSPRPPAVSHSAGSGRSSQRRGHPAGDQRRRPRPITVISTALVVLVALNAIASAVGARWAWLSRHAYEQLRGPEQVVGLEAAVQHYEPISRVLTYAGVFTYVVAAILWISWLYRIHWNLRCFPETGLPRHSLGWAIGGWFVPFLNLVRPKQMMDDAWRGSDPRAASAPLRYALAVPWLIHLWWLVWLISFIKPAPPAPASDGQDVVGNINSAVALLWSDGVQAVVALFALGVVISLTRRHSRWLRLQAEQPG